MKQKWNFFGHVISNAQFQIFKGKRFQFCSTISTFKQKLLELLEKLSITEKFQSLSHFLCIFYTFFGFENDFIKKLGMDHECRDFSEYRDVMYYFYSKKWFSIRSEPRSEVIETSNIIKKCEIWLIEEAQKRSKWKWRTKVLIWNFFGEADLRIPSMTSLNAEKMNFESK